VSRESQCGLAVVPELEVQVERAIRYLDPARSVPEIGIVIPDLVEMRELGGDPAEIVPDAVEDGLDFLRRFLGKGGREIGPTDLVFGQAWTDGAGDAAKEVCSLVGIEIARGPQHPDGERTDGALAERLGRVAKMFLETRRHRLHGTANGSGRFAGQDQ